MIDYLSIKYVKTYENPAQRAGFPYNRRPLLQKHYGIHILDFTSRSYNESSPGNLRAAWSISMMKPSDSLSCSNQKYRLFPNKLYVSTAICTADQSGFDCDTAVARALRKHRGGSFDPGLRAFGFWYGKNKALGENEGRVMGEYLRVVPPFRSISVRLIACRL